MNYEFTDFITEFTEDVAAEYAKLTRDMPKTDRFILGKIQRRAVEIVAEHYPPRNHRKITV